MYIDLFRFKGHSQGGVATGPQSSLISVKQQVLKLEVEDEDPPAQAGSGVAWLGVTSLQKTCKLQAPLEDS